MRQRHCGSGRQSKQWEDGIQKVDKDTLQCFLVGSFRLLSYVIDAVGTPSDMASNEFFSVIMNLY